MTSKRTAVILTTYNRPRLVQDCIRAAMNQTDTDMHLIIMDDGCNKEARAAIAEAIGSTTFFSLTRTNGGHAGCTEGATRIPVTWWKGPQREMHERKSSIPYSRTINIALNHLLLGERYVCFVCDDDALYPDSVGVRAEFLDTHPEVNVCYGRSRSIQYDNNGFNSWSSSAAPSAGISFPIPTGPRVLAPNGLSARTYFEGGATGGATDPDTGLEYVEEGYFVEGPTWYGKPGMIDHNSPMVRLDWMRQCYPWPRKTTGEVEYWGEALSYGVGDAAFLGMLGTVAPFYGINEWVVTKKYHALSDGVSAAEVRE